MDALGDDAFGGPPPGGPPKKALPARFAQKTKVAVDKDEEMKDETVQEEVVEKKPVARAPLKALEEKKAPPKATAKPTAGAASAAGPKGPQIQEEDQGAGLSKEEAEAKVVENFPAEVVGCFEDSKKWNEKVEGYKGIATAIAAM